MPTTERTVVASRDLQKYLDKSVAKPLPKGSELELVSFGEYLVERGAISRDQLYSAMKLRDQNPGVRLGECIASLGILSWPKIDRLYIDYASCATYFA